MSGSLRVLAFEPYDRGSHAAVRSSISRRSRHDWTWITRPGRAFKWRMRLAALEMVEAARADGRLEPPPDVVFATSIMSASDLRAALPGPLRTVPLVLYMHENQAAYPAGFATPGSGERDAHFALTNLSSLLTADLVVWNSAFNRDSYLEATAAPLRRSPDARLGDWAERIAARSVVVWPPVEPLPGPRPDRGPVLHKPVTVAWPHRWEHDKGPEALLELAEVHGEALDLRWTILGAAFRDVPPALVAFRERFADRIDHFGHAEDRAEYARLLGRCDWVLSTARHEFFGLAVVEALLAGCLPWLPERLSYPELVPPGARGLSPLRPPEDPAAVRAAVRAHLEPAEASRAVARLDGVLERAGGPPLPDRR